MHPITFIVLIIAGLYFIISKQSSEFRVSRMTLMSAPPAKIFAQVNDLHAWDAWSPWAKLDPNAKVTFEGAPAGVGAVMRWDGNMKMGAGSMTIVENRPDELVSLKLDFLKPMQGTSVAQFTFRPEGNQTVVTWSMTGQKNFVNKAMSLFMNCEKMIANNFEKGLAQLKTVVESR